MNVVESSSQNNRRMTCMMKRKVHVRVRRLDIVTALTLFAMMLLMADNDNNNHSNSKIRMVESLVLSTVTTPSTTLATLDKDTTNTIRSNNQAQKNKGDHSSSTFAVRLHLIRHGETEANRNHLVCGQSDSVSV